MGKYFVVLALLPLCLWANINQRFINPANCQACHPEHVSQWETSWHANSHEDKNPLYQAAITHVQKSTYQTRAEVTIGCAKCHNPRLEASKPNDAYMYAKAFGIESEETKKVESALKEKHIQSGIGCYVCHNIHALHSRTSSTHAGVDLIEWTKGDAIVGPYPANTRSPYHQSQQRDFFVEGNQLCLTCHEGNANANTAIPGYETGTELALASSNERCVDCHMGTPTKQVIAPHISKEGEPPLVRDVRSHLFAGARNSDILSTTLNLLVDATPGKATVRIQNLTPHRVPTGFSGRSGVLEVVFFNGSKIIQTQRAEFRAIHLNQEGQETLSYTATRLKSDTRLKPYEIKTLTFVSPKEATKVEAHLSYFLLSPSLHETLGIEDPVFTRPYPIAKAAAFFK